MKIEHISAGAYPGSQRNDDHVTLFTSAEVTDIVVIDGGSSVADLDYIDERQGDVHGLSMRLPQHWRRR
jgi:hypothetical protein